MRPQRALAAAALTLGLIATGAPAAQAETNGPDFDYSACQFSNGGLGNTDLAVGMTHVRSVHAYVRGTDCGAFPGEGENVSGNPYLDFGYGVGGFLYSDEADPNDLSGFPGVGPYALDNSVAGKKLQGTIVLSDGTSRPFPGPELVIKRKATFGDMGAPSKVKKNKRFSVYAVLLRADWNEGDYVPYLTKSLKLQSRPSGGKWKTIKMLDTGSGPSVDDSGVGVVYRTKIKKKTCFRWVHDGSSTTSAVTSDTDCVKIKK